MKTRTKMLFAAGLITASLFFSDEASAQTRKLPDGTIIYSDGTRRLPNGTVIYKDGTQATDNSKVTLPDGTVVYPGRDANYPRTRTHTRSRRNLPPGQAKKMYGGSAKDYAPGQQKKHHDGEWKGHGKGKHGKEHKD